MKTKSILTLVITSFLLNACINKEDILNSIVSGGKEYNRVFSNISTIKVDITSTTKDAFYSIYYEYPYNNEGDLVSKSALQGTTPIHASLDVPKDVSKVYVIGNREIKEFPVSDLVINSVTKKESALTRSSNEISQEVLDLIDNKYFPEKGNNVRGENIYKCTDIAIYEVPSSTKFEEADLWLTYLSDGGFGKSDMSGKLWFYTYPSYKYKSLTINDCTFYGKDLQGNIVETTYDKISTSNDLTNSGQPIFWSKEENKNTEKGIFSKMNLGRFQKGLNVGFIFKGKNERTQFTTPALNLSVDTHKYIGFTLKYKDGAGNFQIEKPVGNGFICHIKANNFEGNVLGMENRTPNHVSYDGDYNDMLCLIETNPVDLKPYEEILVDTIGCYTTSSGLLLFEDNYPYEGDYDFNDVVVKYSINDYYKTANYRKDINVSLVAKGCSAKNEFGYYNGKDYKSIFLDINGYENVLGGDLDLSNSESKSITLYGKEIKPYLKNSRGYIMDITYNTGEFPYVLDIPISNENRMFRWCRESKRIDEAYKFKAPRAKDWYVTPVNENLIMK